MELRLLGEALKALLRCRVPLRCRVLRKLRVVVPEAAVGRLKEPSAAAGPVDLGVVSVVALRVE